MPATPLSPWGTANGTLNVILFVTQGNKLKLSESNPEMAEMGQGKSIEIRKLIIRNTVKDGNQEWGEVNGFYETGLR